MLIERGANIHAYHDNAIKWASAHGHIVVRYLIDKGANIHANNNSATR